MADHEFAKEYLNIYRRFGRLAEKTQNTCLPSALGGDSHGSLSARPDISPPTPTRESLNLCIVYLKLYILNLLGLRVIFLYLFT